MTAILMDLVMAVRSGGFTRIPYPSYDLPSFDPFACLHFYFEHVSIQGFVSIPMINNYMVTIAIIGIAGNFYNSIGRGINGSSLGGGKIKTSMEFNCFVYRVDAIAK